MFPLGLGRVTEHGEGEACPIEESMLLLRGNYKYYPYSRSDMASVQFSLCKDDCWRGLEGFGFRHRM